MELGVGSLVSDNATELDSLSRVALDPHGILCTAWVSDANETTLFLIL